MISKKEFSEALVDLDMLLPDSQRFTVDVLNVYYKFLSSFEKEEIEAAANMIIEGSELIYRPSIKKITTFANENRLLGRDSAYSDIFNAISRDILLYGSKCPNYTDEILKAIDSVGGWDSIRILEREAFGLLRDDFITALKSNNSVSLVNTNKLENNNGK